MARDKVIQERASANAAEFFDEGPGLRRSTRSWVLAKGDDDQVLLGGLGGFGMGTMWVTAGESNKRDATYAEVPHEPTRTDDFGKTGFGKETNAFLLAIRREADDLGRQAHNAAVEAYLAQWRTD